MLDICGKIYKNKHYKGKAWENKCKRQWLQKAGIDEKQPHWCTKWTRKLRAEKMRFRVGPDGFSSVNGKKVSVLRYARTLPSGNRQF